MVGVLLDDELRLVLAELDGRALASVRRCCRRCCELASSPDLWRELLASLVRQNHFAAATAFDENTLGCVRDIAAVLAQPQAWWVQPRMVVQRSACIAIDVQNTPRPSSSDEVQSAEGGDPTASGLSPSATGPLCQLSTPPDRLSVRFTGPHLGDNRAVRAPPLDQPAPACSPSARTQLHSTGGARSVSPNANRRSAAKAPHPRHAIAAHSLLATLLLVSRCGASRRFRVPRTTRCASSAMVTVVMCLGQSRRLRSPTMR